jgi:ABC-2 type transport system ATP-binding protein
MNGVHSPLELERVGRRYRRNRPWAVRDVTLTIASGSVTALVGPNGAGKSTLLRACVGFERPDEGRILVCGLDPQRQRRLAVESVGYVPQSSALYRGLTIADHLAMAAAARSAFDGAYALGRLRDAGLAADRTVGELSGGEQAQVGLAMALGTQAPLLLLDEPLASLDPLARRDFLVTLVDHVRSRGTSVILSSHIITDIEHACDSVVVLGGGRLRLHTAISTARTQFVTVAPTDLKGRTPIGLFAGTSGEQLALVLGGSSGRAATLEEIVLGHLASGRLQLGAAEAA